MLNADNYDIKIKVNDEIAYYSPTIKIKKDYTPFNNNLLQQQMNIKQN